MAQGERRREIIMNSVILYSPMLSELVVGGMSWATASIFAKFIKNLIMLAAKLVILIHPFV